MAFFTVPSYNVHPKGPRSQPGKGLGKNQRKNGYTLVKYPGFLLGFNDGSYFIKWELMGFQSWTNYGKSSKICQNMFIFKKIGIVYMWLGYGACWLVHVFSKRHVFEQNIAKHQIPWEDIHVCPHQNIVYGLWSSILYWEPLQWIYQTLLMGVWPSPSMRRQTMSSPRHIWNILFIPSLFYTSMG